MRLFSFISAREKSGQGAATGHIGAGLPARRHGLLLELMPDWLVLGCGAAPCCEGADTGCVVPVFRMTLTGWLDEG